MNTRRAFLLALVAAPWGAQAQPAELASALPGARLQGQGRLTWFGLQVYDARLWVADGFKADDYAARPLALELTYARALVGRQIAERSLQEMKKVGSVSDDASARWLAAMTQCFPDVAKGDRITGVYRPAEGVQFLLNGRPLGDVKDPEFATLFIAIWLSPKSSEPKLRQSLLGLA